jgi:hypothetical protein
MFSTKLLPLRRGGAVAGVASLRIELEVGLSERVIYEDGRKICRGRNSSSRAPIEGDNGCWLMGMMMDEIHGQDHEKK